MRFQQTSICNHDHFHCKRLYEWLPNGGNDTVNDKVTDRMNCNSTFKSAIALRKRLSRLHMLQVDSVIG